MYYGSNENIFVSSEKYVVKITHNGQLGGYYTFANKQDAKEFKEEHEKYDNFNVFSLQICTWNNRLKRYEFNY